MALRLRCLAFREGERRGLEIAQRVAKAGGCVRVFSLVASGGLLRFLCLYDYFAELFERSSGFFVSVNGFQVAFGRNFLVKYFERISANFGQPKSRWQGDSAVSRVQFWQVAVSVSLNRRR